MLDYKKLGLKIGLEIHRQMNTHKLFCSCPSILTEKTDLKIKRRLRSVVSELREEDIVAKYEMGKNKYALYEILIVIIMYRGKHIKHQKQKKKHK